MSDKVVTKRHPAPHVSSQSGKRRCKSKNTIVKAKVCGEPNSAKFNADKIDAALAKGASPIRSWPPYVNPIRQRKKAQMAKWGVSSGKSFKRAVKKFKREQSV